MKGMSDEWMDNQMNAHGHEFWTQIAANVEYTKLLKGKITLNILAFFQNVKQEENPELSTRLWNLTHKFPPLDLPVGFMEMLVKMIN